MKTIAAPAMTAIEAGEAIVTGAVEITPLGGIADALNVPATSFTGSLAARTYTFSGYSPGESVALSKPHSTADSRLEWDGFSVWPSDGYSGSNPPPVIGRTWMNSFDVLGNNGGSDVALFTPTLDPTFYLTEADAYAALAAQLPIMLTGYSTYKIVTWHDPNPSDNRGGLSLLIGGASGSSPLRLWGGYGPIEIDGKIYQGVGARGLAQQNAGAVGGIAQGLTLALSGIEPAALELLNADEIKGASVVLRRMIFAGDGKTLLDAHVFDRGRVDAVETDEMIGGQAAISVAVESAARGLGRAGARRRADSDQRLIDATDGYFKNTSYAGQKTLYWGGKRPRYGGSS